MSITHGMNVAEVEALGRLLQNRHAAELRDIVSQVETLVGNTASTWVGKDANDFRSWWPAKRARLQAMADDLHGFGQSALNNATEQRRASAESTGGSPAGAEPGRAAVDTLANAAASQPTPAAVASWWTGLSKDQQDSLIANRPEAIGNLDGIAPAARFEANRIRLESFLRNSGGEGLSFDRAVTYAKFLRDPDLKLLLFDPTGDGRLAQVFGDLETAEGVAVVIPGIGNSADNFDPTNAVNLQAAGSGRIATIMWLGYDTPPGIELDALSDRSTFSPDRAEQWAPNLVDFTAGLRATVPGEISVVAHSYGTVLAAEAAKAGMKVDRVVLLGSPGIPADTAAVFDGADVYAIRNGGDPVADFSVHGTDPTDPGFGAKVLPGNGAPWVKMTAGKAIGGAAGSVIGGAAGSVIGGAVGMNIAGLPNHSTYFNPDSTSLDGIVEALESPRVGPDGMTTRRYIMDDGTGMDITTDTF